MANYINVKPVKNGFSNTNIITLKKTSQTEIKIQAFHIPNPKDDGKIHHYGIELSIWKKNKQTKEYEPYLNEDIEHMYSTTKSIKIQEKDVLDKLLKFLISQDALIGKRIEKEIILADKEEFIEINKIKDQLSKNELTISDLNSLDTIINIKKFTASRNSLIKLIEYLNDKNTNFLNNAKNDPLTSIYTANQKEKFFQNWIESNLWVFGTSYIRKLDKTKLSFNSDSDIVMETLDGFYELIEIKLPSVVLFKFDDSHNSYYPSPALSSAIGQVLKYLQDVAEYKHQIEKVNKTTILFPKAKLIIGIEPTKDGEKEALRRFNSSLNNIEILTYDNLIKNAGTLIEIYKSKVI